MISLVRILHHIVIHLYLTYMISNALHFQISSSSEAIDFLLELEKSDRNAVKYVVLDCPPNMAKVIVSGASFGNKLILIYLMNFF